MLEIRWRRRVTDGEASSDFWYKLCPRPIAIETPSTNLQSQVQWHPLIIIGLGNGSTIQYYTDYAIQMRTLGVSQCFAPPICQQWADDLYDRSSFILISCKHWQHEYQLWANCIMCRMPASNAGLRVLGNWYIKIKPTHIHTQTNTRISICTWTPIS